MTRVVGMFGALLLVAGLGALWFSPPVAAIPPGRSYEMVSPPYKEGYGVKELLATSPDGDGVMYRSQGGFAGVLSFAGDGTATYLSRRGESGWSASGEMPPPFGGVIDFSTDLGYVLGKDCAAPNAGVEQYACTEESYLLHQSGLPDLASNWELAGATAKSVNGTASLTLQEGASPDLCHVVIGLGGEAPLLPEAENTYNQAYDLAAAPAGGCPGDGPPLRLVAVRNKPGPHGEPEVINRKCKVEVAIEQLYATSTEPENDFNAVADDGAEVFFTTGVVPRECGRYDQLFVRLGGSRTLEVSRPLEASKPYGGCNDGGKPGEVPGEVPCAGAASRASAYFKGASEDGTLVLFTTVQPLTAEDTDGGNDLYLARIGCPSTSSTCSVAEREITALEMVSHDPNEAGSGKKEAADVQGVVTVAPDGSRVYFVARGDLLSAAQREAAAANGSALPRAGADNLYVYDSASRSTAFIAQLCSGPAHSGEVEDVGCPKGIEEGNRSPGNDTSLWTSAPEAQVNRCEVPTSGGCESGRYLVFASFGRLAAGDTNDMRDVYRYDARTGALQRVSGGEGGYDADGNAGVGNAVITASEPAANQVYRQHGMGTRAINDDGSRIVFSTSRPLSPLVSNGQVNVYEWHEGEVALVSSGSAEANDLKPVISPSGEDIFFVTQQGLLSQDTDGLYDIYDARMGGGFPEPPPPARECSGDACQGPLTNPAPLLVPGSATQVAGENLPPPKAKPAAKKKSKRSKKRHKRKRRAKRARRSALRAGEQRRPR